MNRPGEHGEYRPRALWFRHFRPPAGYRGQKPLLYLYQPEAKAKGHKVIGQVRDPEAIIDDIWQFLEQQVDQVRAGRFSHPGGPITTGKDVARLVQPLAKKAQENQCAVCLDKDGYPVAVLKHTVGRSDMALADPRHMLGAVYEIPGVKSFWIVHNQPGPARSKADMITS